MTPTDEARFLTLYAQGQTYRQMAQALGCALSTVADRVKALAAEGKLTARPRGGASPRQKALARQGSGTGGGVSSQTPEVPTRTPRVSRRVSTWVSQPVPVEVLPSLPTPAGNPEMTPLLHEILQELRTLTRGLAGRVSDQTPQVSQSTPQVPAQVSERVSLGVSIGAHEKTQRWNLHLPIDLITTTKAKAQALGVHPSELVAEVLRRWLAEEA